MINTLEQAYEVIGLTLLKHARPDGWTSLILRTPLFADQCGGVVSVEQTLEGTELDIPIGMDVFDIQRAALFIRDQMLATTGHRIYELTFNLTSAYKVSLQYGYEKPEGYEESSDTITLGEAVDRLINMGVEVDESNLGWKPKQRTAH